MPSCLVHTWSRHRASNRHCRVFASWALLLCEGVFDSSGCGRWLTRKQQSSMRSPWEQEWAQGQAAGMARAPGARQGIRLGAQVAGAAAEAEAPLSRATASTRTSKLAWTTLESLELVKEQQWSADCVPACGSQGGAYR